VVPYFKKVRGTTFASGITGRQRWIALTRSATSLYASSASTWCQRSSGASDHPHLSTCDAAERPADRRDTHGTGIYPKRATNLRRKLCGADPFSFAELGGTFGPASNQPAGAQQCPLGEFRGVLLCLFFR
jgi:hypothetical protein